MDSPAWQTLGIGRSPRCLLVASTGGHLAELVRVAGMVDARDDSVWVTFDSPQSRSLLVGKDVRFVPYVGQRDMVGTLRTIGELREILRSEAFDVAISTGAAIAVAALPFARLRGWPACYIESVSRTSGPSLTGRLIAASHTARLYTQHPGYATRRWRQFPSVLASYRSLPKEAVDRPRLFVTLGTLRGYQFRALVDGVLNTGLADERTVWQLGATRPPSELPGTVVEQLDAKGFEEALAACDVVVAHAGVGTLLRALESGKRPVLVPRRKSRGEHVDDHQLQICDLARQADIAAVCDPEDLTAEFLVRASGNRIEPVTSGNSM